MVKNGMRPVHPGQILLEDYMKPLGLSKNALAKMLDVPTSRANGLVKAERGVTADTALPLQQLFGSEAEGWMNLQSIYDLRIAEKTVGKRILKDVAPISLTARAQPPAPFCSEPPRVLSGNFVEALGPPASSDGGRGSRVG